MKIAIVGFGLEGKSSYKYFAANPDNQLTICDINPALLTPVDATSQLGDGYLNNLGQFDLVIRTSGLEPEKIINANPNIEHKITSQLNEFLKKCPSKNIIGVTGTKGKGTTSTLIAEILEAGGKDVVLAGNMGLPMLDTLGRVTEDTYVVLELSSFQLCDLNQKSPHICLCLMVVPEHLNWHPDLESYLNAKANLFSHQTENDIAIYLKGNDLTARIVSTSPATHIPFYSKPNGAYVEDELIKIDDQTVCSVFDVKLPGKHNLQNICAAITAAWQIDKNINAMQAVIKSFTGLEHRLELVKELDGVKYYDDSFGTTPETAIVAIEAFEEPKVIIVGGSDKGTEFDGLANTIIESSIRYVICIGTTGVEIAALLDTLDPEMKIERTLLSLDSRPTMEDIVALAQTKSETGDIVLLSTGSASFDMFENYKDRGDQFQQAVNNL